MSGNPYYYKIGGEIRKYVINCLVYVFLNQYKEEKV